MSILTQGEIQIEARRGARRAVLLAAFLAATLARCSQAPDLQAPDPQAPAAQVPGAAAARPDAAARAADSHSFARPDEMQVTHMSLDWAVDFGRRVVDGSVLLTLRRETGAGAAPLRLDTRDLEIREVEAARSAGGSGAEGRFAPAAWRAGRQDALLGTELIVDLPEGADLVRIVYSTSPSANGLQWLSPEQTAGRKLPFVYSQGQPILARSFVPCQDSPAARATFDARIRVPAPLRAVMAAESKGGEAGEFRFAMSHPIPSYLIAWAAGDLASARVGPRTGVWAEPSMLEKSASEFADMERMLQAAEGLYGPYRWGRYDVMVLPPSFPLGGMENPMLTFATPTLLAGDRSLVGVVAHEMAHSWAGNMVTNATWGDAWLNEGFTTYLERRIMEVVYGRERSEMEWLLGRQELDAALKEMADRPADQRLRVDVSGRDPDEGSTSVTYEKGALLLRLLEETYGREAFDPFLRAWFDDHAFASVITDDFTRFAELRLLGPHPPMPGRARPDLFAWIDAAGLPADAPAIRSAALAMAEQQAGRFARGEATAGQLLTEGWGFHQWRHFLAALPADLTASRMKDLDAAFRFTAAGNAEILQPWLVIGIGHGYEPAYAAAERFLTSQGRLRFLSPLYKEMVKTEAGRRRALAIYAEARPMYHASARFALDPIVGWPAGLSPASPHAPAPRSSSP